MENHLSCQLSSKESWAAILILEKLDFKLKTVVRDVEGHYIILKGSIQQENLTIVNSNTVDDERSYLSQKSDFKYFP